MCEPQKSNNNKRCQVGKKCTHRQSERKKGLRSVKKEWKKKEPTGNWGLPSSFLILLPSWISPQAPPPRTHPEPLSPISPSLQAEWAQSSPGTSGSGPTGHSSGPSSFIAGEEGALG